LTTIELSPSVDRPSHVPESLVYDFDYNADPAYTEDPQARARDLIEHAPGIFWTPRNEGHWVVLPYEPMFEAFRNWEVFSSEHFSPEEYELMMAALPEDQRVPAPIPICVDPPLQPKLRAPLVSTFTPKAEARASEANAALFDALRPAEERFADRSLSIVTRVRRA
jgi:hypothetical protein